MKTRFWHRTICAIAIGISVVGCDSHQNRTVTSPLPQTQSIERGPAPRSWIRPDAKRNTLLYISYFDGVNIYSYPSDEPVGKLGGFESPEGLCSDAKGNVFVTDTTLQRVFEYGHGGTTPIQTIYDSSGQFNPFGCSVDPTSNNLAVTSADSHDVFVFKNESGAPIIYIDRYDFGYFCTYDSHGNLFLNGKNKNGVATHIGELPHGSSTVKDIKLSQPIRGSVGFGWDGKYLSIDGDSSSDENYRLSVHGSKGTIMSEATLLTAKFVVQFTIFDNQLIGPDQSGNQVTFWKYPKGGNPVKSIAGVQLAQGSTISLSR
jgi:hypothetical protein